MNENEKYHDLYLKTLERKLDIAIYEFDFSIVEVYMKAVGWTWGNSKNPPTEAEMIDMIKKDLFVSLDGKPGISKTGGFALEHYEDSDGEPQFSIWFEIEDSTSQFSQYWGEIE